MNPRIVTAFIAATILAAGQVSAAPAAPDIPGKLPTYSYPLSGGDKVRIIVFGEPGIGGDYTINGAGMISLPLIGEVEAKGLTSSQLQARIATALQNGYIKEPRVAIEVLTTRPFYILGEVNRPGEYPFADGMTVESAVAQAGGYTYRAKTRRVMIKHAGEDVGRIVPLTQSTAIAPGDTIRIKERWF